MVIIGVGVLLWLINRFIPMQPTIKGVLNVVVILILIIWLLNVFGILESLQIIRI
ncbi:Thivi_2564 family membrane protein [Marinilabilia rubra]|uniref:Thivi_2564 family membrane protein n=1 Tax=Marinilabilia rubra TaxID=2162893 RepID=UPI00374354E0